MTTSNGGNDMRMMSLIITVLSCASINQGLTPSAKTLVSDFDGSIEVIQKPVSAKQAITARYEWRG